VPYIGLTGVFGSGKSTVLRIFQKLGALCIDADQIVRELTDSDPAICREIGRRVGPTVFKADGTLNRKEVARIIFSDDHKRADLEALLHPYVFAESERKKEGAYRNDSDSMVILEAPLLFEAGYHRMMDATVVVTCPLNILFERLAQRGFSREEAVVRLRTQLSQDEKAALADFRIDNGGSPAETEDQTRRIFLKLKTRKL